MARFLRVGATASATAAMTLAIAGSAPAQSFDDQQDVGPAQQRMVLQGPTTMCSDPETFRQLLVAQMNNNPYRERAVIAQSCAYEPAGARLLVTGDPQSVGVWNSDIVYRVVPVHVLNGPDRDTGGYVIVGSF